MEGFSFLTGVLISQLVLASVASASHNDSSPKRGDDRRVTDEKIIPVLDWAKSIFR
jgi:hypothetical protein